MWDWCVPLRERQRANFTNILPCSSIMLIVSCWERCSIYRVSWGEVPSSSHSRSWGTWRTWQSWGHPWRWFWFGRRVCLSSLLQQQRKSFWNLSWRLTHLWRRQYQHPHQRCNPERLSYEDRWGSLDRMRITRFWIWHSLVAPNRHCWTWSITTKHSLELAC